MMTASSSHVTPEEGTTCCGGVDDDGAANKMGPHADIAECMRRRPACRACDTATLVTRLVEWCEGFDSIIE